MTESGMQRRGWRVRSTKKFKSKQGEIHAPCYLQRAPSFSLAHSSQWVLSPAGQSDCWCPTVTPVRNPYLTVKPMLLGYLSTSHAGHRLLSTARVTQSGFPAADKDLLRLAAVLT